MLGPERDEGGEHRVIATAAGGTGEQKEELTRELMPGEYWIRVRGKPNNESNASDSYLLTVTRP